LIKEWHEAMVMILLAEYSSKCNDNVRVLENRRASNAESSNPISIPQKSVAEILIEALKACEQSFEFCQTTRQATALFSQTMLGDLLKLNDAGEPASSPIISAALQIVRSYTQKCMSQSIQSVRADEESQEYGSWDHFEGMDIEDSNTANTDQGEFAFLSSEVYPMLRRFLSNVFGSDAIPDHTILMSTTDCWYDVANALVCLRLRSWNDFVGQYSTDSWESLRQTRQAQQYGVYFLAKILENDYGFYGKIRLYFLGQWINALCRPDQFLYWEHELTSLILFHDSENELLFNPPFAIRSDAGERLEITMTELRERRTAMVYVVLRNMHRLLALPVTPSESSYSYSKSDFCEILKGIESTMKSFYRDLEATQKEQDDYRSFLNLVIQQMQLYVVDFYKIDPFFTDPLISTAEEYAVTAALKRYGLTIETTGITKAMVLFLYNASERAVIQDTQESLTLQLCNAWLDLSQDAIERSENHNSDQVLLLLFLQNVFPAYIGHALSAPGYMITGPLLQLLTHVYKNLRCRSDFWKPTSIQSLITATEPVLCSALTALVSCLQADILSCIQHLTNFNELVEFVHAAMLRAYEIAHAFPENIDTSTIIEILLALKDAILTIHQPSDVDSYLLDITADDDAITELSVEHSTIRSYTERELQTVLEKTWRQDMSGHWEIIGRGPRKVVKGSRPSSGAAAEREMQECRQRTVFVVREFADAFVSLDWWE
jgi:Mus7/MMS22 family